MSSLDGFAAFILTNGRPHKVYTYATLRSHGYTGPIYLIVDDLDKTKDEYINLYGKEVIIFDKKAIAKTFDQADNFNDMRAIIYARNASFDVAKDLGLKYFIQLDDDYINFNFRFDEYLNYKFSPLNNLNRVFSSILKFYIKSGADSVAISQNGDFIGGAAGTMAKNVTLKRKCMNSFICRTDKPFKFIGRINEDVNTYTRLASTGLLFFTINQVSLQQKATQKNPGGMTELYLDSGTYVKSFYSVMIMPSSVKIKVLNTERARIHHAVSWKHTVPRILNEGLKKKAEL
jgi:hypothetical protein